MLTCMRKSLKKYKVNLAVIERIHKYTSGNHQVVFSLLEMHHSNVIFNLSVYLHHNPPRPSSHPFIHLQLTVILHPSLTCYCHVTSIYREAKVADTDEHAENNNVVKSRKYEYKYKCKYKYKYRYKYTYKCCKQCGQVQKVQLLNLQCYNCQFKRPKYKTSIVSHRRRKNTYYLDRKQLHVVWDSIYLRVFLFCFFI